MAVQEVFTPYPLAANASQVLVNGPAIFGGFICTTAGNFTLQDASGNTLIPSVALNAGQALPCPVGVVCMAGAKVVLSGGAAGTAFGAAYSV